MKKQEVYCELLKLNGKPFSTSYISRGGTVTKEGLLAITPYADSTLLKQDVLRTLLRAYRIPEERCFFSTGSTVTKDALIAMYNAFVANTTIS